MVIPTLAGGARLQACLHSLERQTFRDFAVVVVQNGGDSAIPPGPHVLRNAENRGYGEAINQGAQLSDGEFIAALNDDTEAAPEWLEAMVQAMEQDPGCGMVAPQILLGGTGQLDSAGMLLARDGSSKQRGHLDEPERWQQPGETLLPSGCAALFRRKAWEEAGGFDRDFFLYCEETDLGLRLRWLGWTARYEPRAVLRHDYSQTAGRASANKARYVERNRLRLVVKTFPWHWAALSFVWSAARYCFHLLAFLQGRGKAGEFRQGGGGGLQLAWIVVRAHADLLLALPRLLAQRREVMRGRRISTADFMRQARAHRIGLREVAAL